MLNQLLNRKGIKELDRELQTLISLVQSERYYDLYEFESCSKVPISQVVTQVITLLGSKCPINITYEINHPALRRDFSTSGKEQELVIALRNSGFLVSITKDNLVSSNEEDEEVATTYGYGKKIGFSALGLPVHGYYNGTDKVLWNNYGEFNKWSKCNYIPMYLSVEDIINILTRNDEKDINWIS